MVVIFSQRLQVWYDENKITEKSALKIETESERFE